MSAAEDAINNMAAASYLPPSPPSGEADCPLGNVRIGVFFDGTGNNMHVDAKDPYAPGDEHSAWSNVAYLFEAYQGKEGDDVFSKIYHHGVGTDAWGPWRADEPWYWEGTWERYPSGIGAGFGAGGKARVRWALGQLAEFFSKNKNHLAKNKYFDTYGFSRGSAIARDFVNSVRTLGIDNYNERDGYRVRLWGTIPVLEPSYVPHENVVPTFLGIFDTVASFMAGGLGVGNIAYDLFVDHTYVQRTVHLVAEDEVRLNFPLSSVFMDPTNGAGFPPFWAPYQDPAQFSDVMVEIWYPGAHSDVGGGYVNEPATPPVPGHWETSYDPFGLPYDAWVPETPGTPAKRPDLSLIALRDMYTASVKGGVPISRPPQIARLGVCTGDEKDVTDMMGAYATYDGYRAGQPYAIGKRYIHTFDSFTFNALYWGTREEQPCIIALKDKYIHDSRWAFPDKLVGSKQRAVMFMGPQPEDE